MASLFEAGRDAWNSLLGLKRASIDQRADAQPQMIGSDPGREDDNRYLLSAAGQYFRHYTHLEPDRISIYSDCDEMFLYVLAYAAMEAYIEDALQEDMSTGLSIFPESPSPQVQAEILRLFENLELEDRAPSDMWGMAKYGDHFTVLRYEKNVGVFDALPMEPRICHRHEDTNRVLQGFTVGDQGDYSAANKTGVPAFKPWDLVHWRVRGKRPTDPYGTPFFIQVRLIYKILKLMEEQMTVYRMNMHPDRLLFKVFTGNAGPDERRRIVRMWRRDMEKVASFNHESGRFTSEFAPWTINQNLYWPMGQGDQVSGVEKMPGSANSGDILDVAYMRDLFFAGVRIPKAYLGFEDSQGYRGTDTLSAQSIKFARGVKRLQRHFLQGLTRLCRIHLALKGLDSHQPQYAFTLKATPVSYLDEAHKAELYAKRYEALNYMIDLGDKMAASFGEGKFNGTMWMQYVLREFGQFDDDMIMKLTSPAMDGGADVTYLPAGAAFKFENIDDDMRKRIQETVLKDADLRKMLTHDLGAIEARFSTMVHSTSDRQKFDVSKIPDKNSQELYEKAADATITKQSLISKENKERLVKELRDLADHMQKKYASE